MRYKTSMSTLYGRGLKFLQCSCCWRARSISSWHYSTDAFEGRAALVSKTAAGHVADGLSAGDFEPSMGLMIEKDEGTLSTADTIEFSWILRGYIKT